MKVEYHRTLLADRLRNEAFYAALKATVVPGKTLVADIGCGTGVLGFMAAKLGAKRVFLLESGGIVSIARKLARENGLKNIEIVPAHSMEVTPPERVDIVVSETLGNFALEENIIETLSDARSRYLKPGGILLPQHVTQLVTPVVTARYHDELQIWDDVGFGLTFKAAKIASLNNIYVRRFACDDLLQAGQTPAVWDEVALGTTARNNRKGSAQWMVERETTVYGFAVWWSARLIENITLSTSPLDPETHWEQLYLPLEQPAQLLAGQGVSIEIKSKSTIARGTDVTWSVSTLDRSGAVRSTQNMDLRNGYIA
jgi:precorrin-6B methylase 2